MICRVLALDGRCDDRGGRQEEGFQVVMQPGVYSGQDVGGDVKWGGGGGGGEALRQGAADLGDWACGTHEVLVNRD